MLTINLDQVRGRVAIGGGWVKEGSARTKNGELHAYSIAQLVLVWLVLFGLLGFLATTFEFFSKIGW